MNKRIDHFVLPFPISVNAIYTTAYKRILLTPKAREYKARLERELKRIKPYNFGKSRIAVQYVLFGPSKKSFDVANYEKLLTDCLQGVCFDNDSQIDDNRQTRGQVDPENPRVEVFISVYDDSEAMSD